MMKNWSEGKKDSMFVIVCLTILCLSTVSIVSYGIYMTYRNNSETTSVITGPINYQRPTVDWRNTTIDWRLVRSGLRLSDDVYVIEELGWILTINNTGHVIDYR